MKRYWSVEIDNSWATSLIHCLTKIENTILGFASEWTIKVNAGGIDYGIYLNIDAKEKIIEISNQPDGDECYLEDFLDCFDDDEDDEDDEDYEEEWE